MLYKLYIIFYLANAVVQAITQKYVLLLCNGLQPRVGSPNTRVWSLSHNWRLGEDIRGLTWVGTGNSNAAPALIIRHSKTLRKST